MTPSSFETRASLVPQDEGLATVDPFGQMIHLFPDKALEADHGALKRLINPTRGFKSLPPASATIKGFVVMRVFRIGHCLALEPGTAGEVCFVNRLFRHAA